MTEKRQNKQTITSRRHFLGRSLMLGLGCAGASASAASVGADSRPNFIIILCDNLGYGDVGCFGSELHKTPNIDRMAAEGMQFTDFYATSGVCTPSRASLMTGCYPRRVNMHISEDGGAVLRPVSRKGLNPDEVTVAELLKTRGYATACIGKWHLGDQLPFLPRRQGFDYYLGIPYSDDMTQRPKGDRIHHGQQEQAFLCLPASCNAGQHSGALRERPFSRQVGKRPVG
jgi:arylsulfatase A-like enzyme